MTLDRVKRVAIAYILYKRKRRNQKKRRVWIHPVLQERSVKGHFKNLFEDLLNDEVKLYNYFRMSISTYHDLLTRLKGDLQRNDTKSREAILPNEQLAISIRYVNKTLDFYFYN